MEITDYQKGCKNCCVTVGLNQYLWIKKNHYSLSRVLRKAVNDLMNNKSYEDIKEMSGKIDSMGKIIQQQAQFIEDNKLAERFGHYQDKEDEKALKHKTPEEEADEVLKAK